MKKSTYFIIMGACLTFIVCCSLILGAFLSCNAGGGELIGLKCQNVEIIKACEMEGNIYSLNQSLGGLDV